MEQQKLMAFWKYDAYPYVLHGEVTAFTYDGKVKVKEYGGAVFTPVAVYPYEDGAGIAKIFKKLEADYLNDLMALRKEYKERLREISPFTTPLC